jgi:hypothetical protein
MVLAQIPSIADVLAYYPSWPALRSIKPVPLLAALREVEAPEIFRIGPNLTAFAVASANRPLPSQWPFMAHPTIPPVN